MKEEMQKVFGVKIGERHYSRYPTYPCIEDVTLILRSAPKEAIHMDLDFKSLRELKRQIRDTPDTVFVFLGKNNENPVDGRNWFVPSNPDSTFVGVEEARADGILRPDGVGVTSNVWLGMCLRNSGWATEETAKKAEAV